MKQGLDSRNKIKNDWREVFISETFREITLRLLYFKGYNHGK
jgi:hypothetical protein